jgi:hypothetical protein
VIGSSNRRSRTWSNTRSSRSGGNQHVESRRPSRPQIAGPIGAAASHKHLSPTFLPRCLLRRLSAWNPLPPPRRARTRSRSTPTAPTPPKMKRLMGDDSWMRVTCCIYRTIRSECESLAAEASFASAGADQASMWWDVRLKWLGISNLRR